MTVAVARTKEEREEPVAQTTGEEKHSMDVIYVVSLKWNDEL